MEECIPPVEPSSTGYVIYAGLLGIHLNFSCIIFRRIPIAVFDRRKQCDLCKSMISWTYIKNIIENKDYQLRRKIYLRFIF